MKRETGRTEMQTTGISGLDAQLGGGFPPGNLVLLVGDPVSAMSVFCEQFAAGGLVEGERVIYVSLERSVDEVKANIARYTAGAEKAGELVFLDAYALQFTDTPEALKERLKLPPAVDPLKELTKVMATNNLHSGFRIVIDSLSELMGHYETDFVLKVLRVLKGTLRVAKGLGLVSMVSGLHDPRLVTQVQHLADGVMKFGVEQKGFGVYNYLMITKLRDVPDATRILLFKETEKGLWLESTKRVF